MIAVRATAVETSGRSERTQLIAAATASVPRGDSHTVGRNFHRSVVSPGIKDAGVAVRRDIEIAALVDQQLSVDTEQALGGSRLNRVIGRDSATLRACARARGEQQRSDNGYPGSPSH
jgi:hypothetical protein